MKYVDKGLASIDFGFPVEGYETPYGRAQFVFEYDSARTASPPTTFAELEDWVKANPGLFTYPQPPDFTGSAFIRQAFYATSGGPGQFIAKWRPKLYAQQAPALWEYLNKLKPYLWQEGKAYPKSSAELDTLSHAEKWPSTCPTIRSMPNPRYWTAPTRIRPHFRHDQSSIFNLHSQPSRRMLPTRPEP